MFNIFKPIKDITRQFGGILEGARGFMESAGEGGLKGIAREAFDFNAEGMTEEVDRRMGRMIMFMTMAGDTGSVDIAVRARNFAVGRIGDLDKLKDISAGFDSEDPAEIRSIIDQLAEFLDLREPETAPPDGEELLRQEIARLKQINRQLASLIESEEALLAGKTRPAGRYPTVDAPGEIPSGEYPVVGGSRKKPSQSSDRKPKEAKKPKETKESKEAKEADEG